jgi:RimJ/RimL family protein N-acetyltransferase
MFDFAPLREEDLLFLVNVRNECRDFLHDNRSFTIDECKAWFQNASPTFYIVRLRGERIGYFRLSNYTPADGSIYVGADLHRDFRGRGLARLAYLEFIPWLGERYTVSRLRLEVLSHNLIAQALYRKLGFVEVSRRKGLTKRGGTPVDSILMEKCL